VSESAAILLELAFISRSLRDVAGTATWQHLAEDLSPEARGAVIDTLRDIQRTAKEMADTLEPNGENYGLQRGEEG
jgi:hypothetical protein